MELVVNKDNFRYTLVPILNLISKEIRAAKKARSCSRRYSIGPISTQDIDVYLKRLQFAAWVLNVSHNNARKGCDVWLNGGRVTIYIRDNAIAK